MEHHKKYIITKSKPKHIDLIKQYICLITKRLLATGTPKAKTLIAPEVIPGMGPSANASTNPDVS